MNTVVLMDANETGYVSNNFMALVSSDVTTALGNDVMAVIRYAKKLRSGPLYVLSTIAIVQSQPTACRMNISLTVISCHSCTAVARER